MKVGDLVYFKGNITYFGIITKEIGPNGFVVYFFHEKKYYGYDKTVLELVSE